MKRTMIALAVVAALAPLCASASDGYVNYDISLQAGPDESYPSIEELPAGTYIGVEGCVDGYTWCDVVAGDARGWIPGSFINEMYDNQPVILADYGPRISVPIVTFSIGTYWDQHYRSRPFYTQRTQWEERRIAPREHPRPPASAVHTPPPARFAHAGAPQNGHPQPQQKPVVVNNTTNNTIVNEHRPSPTKVENKTVEATHTTQVEHPQTVQHTAPPKPAVVATHPNEQAHVNAPPKPETHTVTTPKTEPKVEAKPAEHKEDVRKDDDHGH